MTLHFKETAEADFFEIADGYYRIRSSLADDFAKMVFKRLDDIREFPSASPQLSKQIRKTSLGKFPYHLIYQIRDDEIWVVAIWHNKRKPGYWKRRNKKS